jgi:cbb3-type cytochrome oxidase subunit 3
VINATCRLHRRLHHTLTSQVFLGREAPDYPTGFGISLATVGLGIVLAGLLWWMLARENARRENLDKAIVSRLSPLEIEEMGDNAPTFRYIL